MKPITEITLAQGNGGQGMQQLIDSLFLQAFSNPYLNEKEDQARIPLAELQAAGDRLAFSTDSYVIDPIIFPGGNIGKLAVCGTANDLSVGGAVPRYLSCGFILEEGLSFEILSQLVTSMAETAKANGIQIVTGDTKVVQRGAADKIFINTAGIGVIPSQLNWAAAQCRPAIKLLSAAHWAIMVPRSLICVKTSDWMRIYKVTAQYSNPCWHLCVQSAASEPCGMPPVAASLRSCMNFPMPLSTV